MTLMRIDDLSIHIYLFTLSKKNLKLSHACFYIVEKKKTNEQIDTFQCHITFFERIQFDIRSNEYGFFELVHTLIVFSSL